MIEATGITIVVGFTLGIVAGILGIWLQKQNAAKTLCLLIVATALIAVVTGSIITEILL